MSNTTGEALAAFDPSYDGHSAIAFTGFFLALQIIFVSLRGGTKWFIKGIWGYDDLLVLITLVFQIGIAAVSLDALTNGAAGLHTPYAAVNFPLKLRRWYQDLYAISFLYNFTAVLPKLAILILYRRLFNTSKTLYSIYILMAILILDAVGLTALVVGECQPIAANWDNTIPNGRCLNKRVVSTWITIPNIVTDVWMLILPIPIIWKLHIVKRVKLGLTCTFLIGSIGLAASIGRFVIGLNTNSYPDLTWVAPELIIWIQVEPGCYLISACLLTLRPLLDRIVNSNFVQGSRRNIYRALRWTLTGTNASVSAGSNMEMKAQPFSSGSKGNAIGKGFNPLSEEGRTGSTLKSVMGTIVVGADEVDVEMGKDRGHTSGGSKPPRYFEPRTVSAPKASANNARTFFHDPTSEDG
ncbi:hypothetical protein N431DRAFT_531070 [Stipitochalara longipes BDJ]|nr:hypothetical protein N431DRAFT_531070 [Stipitochalara longipes BDJ]